jgi:hypothetical protein
MPGQIQEVYAELGQVLNHPEAFGLGSRVPRPLADTLDSTRRMLEQALRERQMARDGDLEMELAQDADRDAL